MSAQTEIIERLKKLLRLARSGNAHEAALAMQKALELAALHRISIDQINPDHEAPKFTHRDHSEHFVRLPHEHQFAAMILNRFFRVKTIYRTVCRAGRDGWPQRRETIAIVGTESDVEIADYVLGFLVHHFRFCWRNHRGRCRNRAAFMRGMFAGLYHKLEAAEPNTPEPAAASAALVITMNGYLAEHFGELKGKALPSGDSEAALRAGYMQGRKTEILNGLKAGSSSTLALQ